MLHIDIKPEHLRPLQIVHVAIAGGVFVFLMIVLFLPGAGADGPQMEGEVLSILSMIHAVFFFVALGVGRFLYDSRLRRDRLESLAQGAPPEDAALRIIAMVRQASILRLALLEAPAFLGLAIVLIARVTGNMEPVPVYWFNALSAVFLFGFIAFTFPTREKIADLLR